jgi:hypothetical protein
VLRPTNQLTQHSTAAPCRQVPLLMCATHPTYTLTHNISKSPAAWCDGRIHGLNHPSPVSWYAVGSEMFSLTDEAAILTKRGLR